MINLSEYRRRNAYLPDFLSWAALVEDGIVLNKDGSLQRTARFRGPDLDSAVPAELATVSHRINNAFRRLGDGWAVFVEAQRVPACAYPDSRFRDPASALVDAERKADFESLDSHFESHYYLTLLFLPPEDVATRGNAWLFEGGASGDRSGMADVTAFKDRTERMLDLIDGFMPECAWLNAPQTLTYLHSTVSTKRHNVRVPETPMHLDALLADEPLNGGVSPMLGRAHLRILTICGFPTETTPGILDELNRLAFPYRWSTRAILMDKARATTVLGKIRRQWFAKRKSIASIVKEVMTNEASALTDNDASNKAADADAALQELGADIAGLAWVTATVTVWDEDASRADEKLRLVEKVIQSRDFTCIAETLNAVDAWLGSIPGHVYANVRQPPISTLNLAHLMPASAVWAGPERDDHLDGPPLLFGKTEGSTPFRFSLHVGDVGHSLVVGPTGSGKSVLLALMVLQFKRYPYAQVFAFDFGASLRAATLAMRGDWHDLGGDAAGLVRLQPLLDIDKPSERAWASQWIADLLGREGIEVTPEVKEHVWSALTSLSSAPTEERTLTGLCVLLQSQPLKQALASFCVGGAYGGMLDSDCESLRFNPVQVFETQGLVGTSSAPAVLSYLFHRIEDHLNGSPTLIVIDEGWLALDDHGFSGQVREWLKTLRKANASVLFATQSLADIAQSDIATVLIESCPTRIFLPNTNALEPQVASIYGNFGLNSRQIQLIARAMPKREYYLQSAQGDRLFELGLGDIALALCASSSKTDQAALSQIYADVGAEQFLAAWLTYKGYGWAADLLPNLTLMETPQ